MMKACLWNEAHRTLERQATKCIRPPTPAIILRWYILQSKQLLREQSCHHLVVDWSVRMSFWHRKFSLCAEQQACGNASYSLSGQMYVLRTYCVLLHTYIPRITLLHLQLNVNFSRENTLTMGPAEPLHDNHRNTMPTSSSILLFFAVKQHLSSQYISQNDQIVLTCDATKRFWGVPLFTFCKPLTTKVRWRDASVVNESDKNCIRRLNAQSHRLTKY